MELPYEPLYQKGEGEPLLLLRGLVGNLGHWSGVIGQFSSTHKVLVPRFPFYSSPINKERLDDLVDYLDRFVTENCFGKKVSIIGNALGGHIAMLYAWQQPSRVKKLVLSGSTGLFENSFGDLFPVVNDYENFQGKIESASKFLHLITAPTLLIWGLQDAITPPEVALEFHDLLPNSKVFFLDECAHEPMVEQPDRFNHHIKSFIERNDLFKATDPFIFSRTKK